MYDNVQRETRVSYYFMIRRVPTAHRGKAWRLARTAPSEKCVRGGNPKSCNESRTLLPGHYCLIVNEKN